MKKRWISLLLAAAMTMALATGCSDKPEESAGKTEESAGKTEEPSDKTEEQVTITVWTWDSGYIEATSTAYMETHPNVNIEVTAVEHGDMLSKTQRALASGSEVPTILTLDNLFIENWKAMDILEDLTQYGFDNSEYVESLAEQSVTADGEVIGAQLNVCPAGIAYKRDLAKEYFGTDDPEELFQIFNSYDAYVEKGAEVYEKSDGKVHLFHSAQAVAEWLYFASNIPNMDGDTINYTEKMTDIMSILAKLRDANAVDTYQNGTPEANATYADDTHIFYPCPNWSPAYYIQGNDPDRVGNWGIMHAPSDYNHGGGAAGITKSATEEQKQTAYDFIVWSTQGDGATAARDAVGYIVPYKPLMEDAEWVKCTEETKEYFGGQDITELFYQEIAPNMEIATPTLWDESMINVRTNLAQLLTDDKDMTLEEALKVGKEQLTQLVTDDSIKIQ